jgi:hypothetical protein
MRENQVKAIVFVVATLVCGGAVAQGLNPWVYGNRGVMQFHQGLQSGLALRNMRNNERYYEEMLDLQRRELALREEEMSLRRQASRK